MHGDAIGGPIRGRLYVAAPPKKVVAALAPDARRASFRAVMHVRADEWIETHAGRSIAVFHLGPWLVHAAARRSGSTYQRLRARGARAPRPRAR